MKELSDTNNHLNIHVNQHNDRLNEDQRQIKELRSDNQQIRSNVADRF